MFIIKRRFFCIKRVLSLSTPLPIVRFRIFTGRIRGPGQITADTLLRGERGHSWAGDVAHAGRGICR